MVKLYATDIQKNTGLNNHYIHPIQPHHQASGSPSLKEQGAGERVWDEISYVSRINMGGNIAPAKEKGATLGARLTNAIPLAAPPALLLPSLAYNLLSREASTSQGQFTGIELLTHSYVKDAKDTGKTLLDFAGFDASANEYSASIKSGHELLPKTGEESRAIA